MTLEEYMRELILMSRQYGQEEELYPLINMLLRENDNVRHLSVRDVHKSGSTGIRKDMLYGYVSFPDLAILDENNSFPLYGNIYDKKMPEGFNRNEQLKKIHGCVEIKKWIDIKEKTKNDKCIEVNKYIDTDEKVINYIKTKKGDIKTIGDFEQVVGELLWYGKVLYTNGFHWHYLEIKTTKKVNIVKQINKYNTEIKNIEKEINSSKKEKKETKELNNKKQKQEWERKRIIYNEYNKQKDVICIDIGNITDIYNYIISEKSSMKDIVQGIIENPNILKEWHRLKYNLASINWCGTNTAEQFL